MPPALRNLQLLCVPRPAHPVHQPVLQRYPSRPPAFEIAAQGLRLARPREGRARAFLDQVIQECQ